MSIKKPLLNFTLLFGCALFLTACVSAYQPDIVQGNRIGNNELATISIGMTKEEVQTALGNPLITDMFTNNRWDYFYLKDDVSKNQVSQKTVTLNFSENRLTSITGDVDLNKINAAKTVPEAQSTGGTIVTKPTQKRKGIFSN